MDVLDRVAVRDLVASLPAPERALAELLMAGHTQTSAARELRVTGRAVRKRMRLIRRRLAGRSPRSPPVHRTGLQRLRRKPPNLPL